MERADESRTSAQLVECCLDVSDDIEPVDLSLVEECLSHSRRTSNASSQGIATLCGDCDVIRSRQSSSISDSDLKQSGASKLTAPQTWAEFNEDPSLQALLHLSCLVNDGIRNERLSFCEASPEKSPRQDKTANGDQSEDVMPPRPEAPTLPREACPLLSSRRPPSRPSAPGQQGPPEARAFQKWGRYHHGPLAGFISELTEARAVDTKDDNEETAYQRPANKRDLGHRCQRCRQPFNVLGQRLVAVIKGIAMKGGPAQRFHEECWKKGRATRLARVAWRDEDSPQAYTEAWRETDSSSSGWTHLASKFAQTTFRASSILDGVLSFEDESGNRRISRGFTSTEMNVALSKWKGDPGDLVIECAICCGNCSSSSLRLPCSTNHMFCVDCIVPWFRLCSLCPSCRTDVRPFLSRFLPRASGAQQKALVASIDGNSPPKIAGNSSPRNSQGMQQQGQSLRREAGLQHSSKASRSVEVAKVAGTHLPLTGAVIGKHIPGTPGSSNASLQPYFAFAGQMVMRSAR
eukprot:gnl/MRDRNA2_/MRDRNA2_239964_c0_seq1.p1 gnl/MRDRNA2_/MRDRNA2_239964_c0~~gnl/MRDRNA2_/MRDRNA2_239964_c0_seq1.p1  ORF type:complete len:520 (-),score=63.90 gnl/MRDRNA2_/MRDRNA2_239964_c0_seq1:103-1662(-)